MADKFHIQTLARAIMPSGFKPPKDMTPDLAMRHAAHHIMNMARAKKASVVVCCLADMKGHPRPWLGMKSCTDADRDTAIFKGAQNIAMRMIEGTFKTDLANGATEFKAAKAKAAKAKAAKAKAAKAKAAKVEGEG